MHCKSLRLYLCTLFFMFFLSACGFNKSGIVIPELLDNVGWQQVPNTLSAEQFSAYAELVGSEVLQARVPFVKNNLMEEATLASPAEFQPAAYCEQTRGIAILVHGLSDTAFSMRDIAKFLASQCYLARTALLPGHGTRPGDLLTIRLDDWTDTVQYLIAQAADDHEHVITVGFSLGALLTLTEALKNDSRIDAMITISPAFYLTTSPWARLTVYLHPFVPWLDKEKPDDTYRYEAIPTVAVAETVKAKDRFHRILKQVGGVKKPWLVLQSDDDLVIETVKIRALFNNNALHQASKVVTFYGDSEALSKATRQNDNPQIVSLSAFSDSFKVTGLTHVAIHQSPQNKHYGVNGKYRNCGIGGPRSRVDVRLCQEADDLWLGPWNGSAPDNGAFGMSTYNPYFDALSDRISSFLEAISTDE